MKVALAACQRDTDVSRRESWFGIHSHDALYLAVHLAGPALHSINVKIGQYNSNREPAAYTG
jgi:hypothetical protein